MGIGRHWFSGGDATFSKRNYRLGSLLEMHVRVTVAPAGDRTSTIRLRFFGGFGSALLLVAIEGACALAFVWAVATLITSGWQTLEGAGLFAILIPPLLVLAMRAAADADMGELADFVATTVRG